MLTSGPFLSLYVTNLPSAKIKKPDLRTALYLLFSTYGPVLDIVVLKTMKMRGQAHIVYRDIQTSTQAMRALNGSEFLGMHMVRPALAPRYPDTTLTCAPL
ncbi:RNA recognition motif domain-containing protein [Candidatus Bathyarchaeota archaeon]|nr:RNA recognition motif domain-containing protein [Candidatus Bathyarchaeota archaeon]